MILRQIGEDPERPGLIETPDRVVRSWAELYEGYRCHDPAALLKTFPDDTVPLDRMIMVDEIPFYSMCEHHMLPFHGKVAIGYLPQAHRGVIGVSKLPRVVEEFARRLQVQERLTEQICDALMTVSRAAIVLIHAKHECVAARGVESHGTNMNTITTKAEPGIDIDGLTAEFHTRRTR